MRILLGVSWYWGGVMIVAIATIILAYLGWQQQYSEEHVRNHIADAAAARRRDESDRSKQP